MRVSQAIAALKALNPNEYIAIEWRTKEQADRYDELNETQWVEVTDLAEGHEAETFRASIRDRVREQVESNENFTHESITEAADTEQANRDRINHAVESYLAKTNHKPVGFDFHRITDNGFIVDVVVATNADTDHSLARVTALLTDDAVGLHFTAVEGHLTVKNKQLTAVRFPDLTGEEAAVVADLSADL